MMRDVDDLAPPPRPVPPVFLAGFFAGSVWESLVLATVLLAAIPLYVAEPGALPVVVLVVLALAWAVRGLKTRLRWVLLARGEVAEVEQVEHLRSSTSYANVLMRQAVGWEVSRHWYSGAGRPTKVVYRVRGKKGETRVGGMGYAGGTILADPALPIRALVVSRFPIAPRPGPDGGWTGGPDVWQLIGIVLTAGVQLGLVVGAVRALG